MKAIIATYWFRSSNGATLYETLGYMDGTTSCNCPGWTRRVDEAGKRSCKHTRMVLAGLAGQHCERSMVLGKLMVNETVPTPPPAVVRTARKSTNTDAPGRTFNFDED